MKSQTNENVITSNKDYITSLRSLVEGYILNCRCEAKSQATIKNYQYRLHCFLWFCQERRYDRNPRAIKANHVREFLWYLASESNRWGGSSANARRPASSSTINHYYRVLSTFFGWLYAEDIINENPMERMKAPKVKEKMVQALAENEVVRMLSKCLGKERNDVRNRAIVMMLLDTGMRVSELTSLCSDDVDMKTGAILVRNGKGGKQRIVRIGSKAQKALWRYVVLQRGESKGALFLAKGGDGLGVSGIKRVVRCLGCKAGIHGVHVHRLRHTFAVIFLRRGGDVFSLRYLLGHSTLRMTQRYLQSLSAEDAIKAHRRFSPMDNMSL